MVTVVLHYLTATNYSEMLMMVILEILIILLIHITKAAITNNITLQIVFIVLVIVNINNIKINKRFIKYINTFYKY